MHLNETSEVSLSFEVSAEFAAGRWPLLAAGLIGHREDPCNTTCFWEFGTMGCLYETLMGHASFSQVKAYGWRTTSLNFVECKSYKGVEGRAEVRQRGTGTVTILTTRPST